MQRMEYMDEGEYRLKWVGNSEEVLIQKIRVA